METIDPLKAAAVKKELKKGKRKWFDLSTIGRHGKITDIKVSATDGVSVEQVVNRTRQAGNPSSTTGFALGDVTRQNLDN